MSSNIWIVIVNVLTVITIALAVMYAFLWIIRLVLNKISAKLKSSKTEVIERYLNKINKVVTKMVIGAWLVLIVMNVVDSLPELKQIIKIQLGDKMDIINVLHSVMQTVLLLIVIGCVIAVGVLLRLKYKEDKKVKDEDTSDMY